VRTENHGSNDRSIVDLAESGFFTDSRAAEGDIVKVTSGQFGFFYWGGAVNPLGAGVFVDGEVYLGVAVYHADSSTWEMLLPRQPLTSTPYAFQAENTDTLEGYGSADFAPTAHMHSGGDITSGTVDEAHIDPTIARDAEISWGNLAGIPGDIADGDQVGITVETDPTITDPSVKDGVSWSELSGMPAGFADGQDNVGVTASSDYGRSGVSSTLYEGATALTNKYVGKTGSQMITNGDLTVNTPYGVNETAVTGVKGFAQSDTYGFGLIGEANGEQGFGLYGSASGETGTGVHGEATNTGNMISYGGHFTANGTYGRAVYGKALNAEGHTNYGGYFVANGITGTGVYGEASYWGNTTNRGGHFIAKGSHGRGVQAETLGTYGRAVDGCAGYSGDNTNYGGYFEANGTTGRGVYGEAGYIGDFTNYGGYFRASGTTGNGAYGEAPYSGVHGRAWGSNGRGVYGEATGSSGNGVYGWAGNTGEVMNYGGHFTARGSYGRGVYGEAANAGNSTNHGGFFIAHGTSGRGVYGEGSGTSGRGVYGKASNAGDVTNYGGYFVAEGTYGYGVYGYGKTYDFYAAGPGTNYGYASSIRWKKNIEEINGALDMVMQMRGVYFDWDWEHGGHHDIGFIAEEVGQNVPEVVVYEEDSNYASGMDYGKMTPILLQAIKEQQIIISELKFEIESLRAEIKAIKADQ
jgi:hypothetical protein